MTDRGAEYRGQNLAVITGNYANISLRLGYHFNVIDTYVSESVDDNYIYFRFVGGVTENERRHLRAVLLKEILEKLDFNVTVSADLVVARLKKVAEKEMKAILEQTGRLIGFTRQLDTQMVSEPFSGMGINPGNLSVTGQHKSASPRGFWLSETLVSRSIDATTKESGGSDSILLSSLPRFRSKYTSIVS